jgi:hypothetical protein
MTDTMEVKGVTALLDSGATDLFIDCDFTLAEKLTMQSLTLPAPVYNVDGTPNEGGEICEVVDVILQFISIRNVPSLLSPISGSTRWSWATLGFGTTTTRSTGKHKRLH